MLNIKPKTVTHVLEHILEIIWEHVPISFKHMSFWYLFLEPHQTTS
jgi:hypothetical protein